MTAAFPMIEAVRSGLMQGSDHWVGRALEWVAQLSDAGQVLLQDGLRRAASAQGVKESLRASAHAYLILLRQALEELGARALCAGARLDVYPSGMSRDMGGGRKAYIHRMGEPALTKDLVDIFDRARAEQVATVAAQREYRDRWAEKFADLR